MSARDELTTLILGKTAPRAADAILAAGYRKPRTITTREELAEAHMVVVRTAAGTIANLVNGKAYCFGYEASARVETLALPVTVLWEREASGVRRPPRGHVVRCGVWSGAGSSGRGARRSGPDSDIPPRWITQDG